MKLEKNKTESEIGSAPAEAEPQCNERKSRYFHVPHYLVFHPRLSVPLRFLLIVLIERENNFRGMQKGAPFFLTQERLASQLGIATSTLKRNLAALEKKKYIKRKFARGDRATMYTINWDLIDKFNTEFEFAVPPMKNTPKEPNTLSSITENRETRESAAEPIMNPTREQNEPQRYDYYGLGNDDGKPF